MNVGFLFLLTEGLKLYFLLSGLIGIEASTISNFIFNDLWRFGDMGKNTYSWVWRFVRPQVVLVTGILINVSILYLLTIMLGVHYIISGLIGISLVYT